MAKQTSISVLAKSNTLEALFRKIEMKRRTFAAILTPLWLAVPVQAEMMTIQPQRLTSPTPTYISQANSNNASLSIGKAADLISQWLEAKQKIFAPPFDRELLANLTTGILYSDTLTAIDYLRQNSSYYRYGVQKVESVERFAASGAKATIEVRVTEDTTFYQNGKVNSSSFNTKLVRYSLEYWDGIWKIADAKVLD